MLLCVNLRNLREILVVPADLAVHRRYKIKKRLNINNKANVYYYFNCLLNKLIIICVKRSPVDEIEQGQTAYIVEIIPVIL
jgi:hypothetical protein